jgi:O-antigen/teichoic acid export membrane protein
MLSVLIGFAFFIPQKVIGPSHWGIYSTAQALLTSVYMLSDSLALQAMVNFGMEESRRRQALTLSALIHCTFITVITLSVYFSRGMIASFFNEPELVTTLGYFPIVSLGFLLRNYFLKVSQLFIDTRATFFIDLAWIGSTVILIVYGWRRGTLVNANDMMVISGISSGISSLMGLWLYRRKVRFTTSFDRAYTIRMIRFGIAQFGSAITMVLQTQGDTLILKKFVTSDVIGNYDAAKKFFRGFEALRDAGALFVYPAVTKLAAERRHGELVLLLEKMIGFMVIVITPIVVFVWLGPTDYLFNLIYKGQYQQAATIFKFLSLAALAIPFSMNTYVLGGLGEARRYFRVTLTSALFSVVAALVLVPMIHANGAALAVVVSFATLGVLATRAVKKIIPFSLPNAFGRWRDALNFVIRLWRRAMRKGDRPSQ